MTDLANAVLPLIRSGSDLSRWYAADAHGRQMHDALAILETAAETEDPTTVFIVTQKAIASAVKVIMRADDSSGIIGDAVRRLLDLHPKIATKAQPPAKKLVNWMMKFQFDNECDCFNLDPVAYAPALGEKGMLAYRAKLDDVATYLGPKPTADQRWASPHSHEWFTLEWNAQRLAVLDRDIEAIIRTHARNRNVAAWFQDTAVAFEEIGEIGLAIDWAKQATDFDRGHQSKTAAGYWCKLLAEHRPDDLLAARLEVFRGWPSSDTAHRFHEAAGSTWPEYRDEVIERLAASPRDAVLFALLSLKDVPFAWNLAQSLALDSNDAWDRLAKAYEKIDPLAVLPIYTNLVLDDLQIADAQRYRSAARRLARMRRLAAGSEKAADVDELIIELREIHRRRPRLQLEFDHAQLP